jgi:hypothetical protein
MNPYDSESDPLLELAEEFARRRSVSFSRIWGSRASQAAGKPGRKRWAIGMSPK